MRDSFDFDSLRQMTIDLIATVVENADKIEQNISRSNQICNELKELFTLNPITESTLSNSHLGNNISFGYSSVVPSRNPYLASSLSPPPKLLSGQDNDLRKHVELLTKKSEDRKRSLKLLYNILTAKEKDTEIKSKSIDEAKQWLSEGSQQLMAAMSAQGSVWCKMMDSVSEKTENYCAVIEQISREVKTLKRSQSRTPRKRTPVKVTDNKDEYSREEIGRLKSALKKAQEEVSEKDQVIYNLQEELNSSENHYEVYNTEKIDLEDQIKNSQVREQSLISKLKKSDDKLSECRNDIAGLKIHIEGLGNDLKFKNEELTAVKEAYNSNKFKAEEQQLRLESRQLRDKLSRMQKETADIESSYATSMADKDVDIERLQSAITRHESQIKDRDSRIQILDGKCKKAEERARDAELRAVEAEARAEERGLEIERAQEKVKGVEKRLKDLEIRCKEAEKLHRESTQEIMSLENNLREAEDLVLELQEDKTNLDHQLKSQEIAFKTSKGKLSELEVQAKLLERQKEDVANGSESKIKKLEDKISGLEISLKAVNEKIKSSELALKTSEESTKQYRSKCDELEQQIAIEERSNRQHLETIEDLRLSLKNAEEGSRLSEKDQVLSLHTENTALKTKIENAREKYKELEDEYSNMERSLATKLKDSQSRLSIFKQETQEKLSAITMRAEAAERDAKTITLQVEKIASDKSKLESECKKAQKAAESSKETCDELKRRLKQIQESQRQSLNDQLSTLQAENRTLANQLESYMQLLSKAELDMVTQKDTFNVQQQRMAEQYKKMAEDLTAAKKRAKEASLLSVEMKTKDEVSVNIQSKIDKLTEDNAVLESDLEDLRVEMRKASFALENKQKDIENLNEEVEVSKIKTEELLKELGVKDEENQNLINRLQYIESNLNGGKSGNSSISNTPEFTDLKDKLERREMFINELETKVKELKYKLHQASTGSLNSEEVEGLKKDNRNFIRKINQLFTENGKKEIQFNTADEVYNMLKSNITVIGGSTLNGKNSQITSNSHIFEGMSPDDMLSKLHELYNENQQLIKDSESLKTQMVHLKEVYLRNNPGVNPDTPRILAIINEFLERLDIQVLDSLDDEELANRLGICMDAIQNLERILAELDQQSSDDCPETEKERPPDLVELEELAAMPEEQRLELALTAYQALKEHLDISDIGVKKSRNKANYFRSLYTDLLADMETEEDKRNNLHLQIESLEGEVTAKQTHFKEHLKGIILKFFESIIMAKDKNTSNPLLELLTNILGFNDEEKNDLIHLFKKGRLKDKLKKIAN